jgi:gamma-glutamylaminecyclotransferase
MCVIIVKNNSNKISTNILSTASRVNPDGLGIVWLDTYEVSHHKSTEWTKLDTDRPFIAHFRYATVGKVGISNTHPFKCGANSDEWLMMNGTIAGLGNFNDCDSKVLARQLGSKHRSTWKAELEKHDSRFVTFNTRTKSYQIYNRDAWVYQDGVWYSKGNVLQTIPVAVYGTLKKNNSNYWHYLRDAQFVGSGETADKYPLIVKGLPYLIDHKGIGYNVDVDVFNVDSDTLIDLDRLEGHPRWYQRKMINVRIGKQTLKCWVYFMENMEIQPEDKIYKTYSQNYSLKPIKQEVSKLDDDLYCINCLNEVEHDTSDVFYCKSCGSWWEEKELMDFNGVFEDTKYDNELPF